MIVGVATLLVGNGGSMDVAGIGIGSNIHHNAVSTAIAAVQQALWSQPLLASKKYTTIAMRGPAIITRFFCMLLLWMVLLLVLLVIAVLLTCDLCLSISGFFEYGTIIN